MMCVTGTEAAFTFQLVTALQAKMVGILCALEGVQDPDGRQPKSGHPQNPQHAGLRMPTISPGSRRTLVADWRPHNRRSARVGAVVVFRRLPLTATEFSSCS